jgi:hypothetical protein
MSKFQKPLVIWSCKNSGYRNPSNLFTNRLTVRPLISCLEFKKKSYRTLYRPVNDVSKDSIVFIFNRQITERIYFTWKMRAKTFVRKGDSFDDTTSHSMITAEKASNPADLDQTTCKCWPWGTISRKFCIKPDYIYMQKISSCFLQPP